MLIANWRGIFRVGWVRTEPLRATLARVYHDHTICSLAEQSQPLASDVAVLNTGCVEQQQLLF